MSMISLNLEEIEVFISPTIESALFFINPNFSRIPLAILDAVPTTASFNALNVLTPNVFPV
ncbi:MAG: hypothetical protein HZT42_06040 [Paracoccaceae bacterium]|nr:MAG: hypothetical protein HZT42_06040 [Paracoccaceae bacterium]